MAKWISSPTAAARPTKARAKALRRRLSLPEVLLWQALKGGQLDGLRFRKQHPVGPYVVDFYCDRLKLVVEVDGESHSMGDRPARDAARDQWLSQRGVRTLRLSASLILESVDDALRTILAETAR